nr:hypothetical protein BgiMline_021501 [Biomphalaria glabrata]
MTKPSQADMTRPSQADMTKPSQADMTKPSQADITKPSQADITKPSKADITKPSQADITKPSQADITKPSQADMTKPSQADMTKPSQADMTKLSQTDMTKPSQAACMCVCVGGSRQRGVAEHKRLRTAGLAAITGLRRMCPNTGEGTSRSTGAFTVEFPLQPIEVGWSKGRIHSDNMVGLERQRIAKDKGIE